MEPRRAELSQVLFPDFVDRIRIKQDVLYLVSVAVCLKLAQEREEQRRPKSLWLIL